MELDVSQININVRLTYLRVYFGAHPNSASAAPNQVEVVRTAAAAPDHQSPDWRMNQTPENT